MTATEISAHLATRAEEVARLLLPGGKRSGNAWLAGSLAGEAGSSLSVILKGQRAGVWKDFAGDADDSGDMIGLWQAVKGIGLREACKAALELLGIEDAPPKFARPMPQPSKAFVRPPMDAVGPLESGGSAFDYLTRTRGLQMAVLDRYRVGQMESKHGAAIVFPIFNPAMEPVCVKYLAVAREGNKKVIWSSADSQDRLFGWQGVDRDSLREVCITEGEVDCLTVAGWGVNALSLPRGVEAHGWIEHDWEDLKLVDRIYLCFDMDGPGQKAIEAVALRLGRDRCWRVRLPRKDPNECLSNGMDAVAFRAALDSASGFDPEELRAAGRYLEEVIGHELAAVKNPTGTPCPFPSMPWRIRDGELTVFTGFSGHGKSLALSQFIAADLGEGQACCIASLEIRPRKTLWILLRQLLGLTPTEEKTVREAFAWMDGLVWIFDSRGAASPDRLFEAFSYAARRYGVKRVVIDSLLFCGYAEDDYNGQSLFIQRFAQFCKDYDLHGYLVAHSRKRDDEGHRPGKMDVRGAGALTDAICNGVTVWRNKAKDEAIERAPEGSERNKARELHDGGLKMWKQRETGEEPSIKVWLHHSSGQFHEKPNEFGKVYLKSP